jgi:hypothetical protein
MAIENSKAQVLLALEQLLEQCEPENVPGFMNDVKTTLAKCSYVLNANRSLLLNLPPELLVEIGNLLLLSKPSHGKRRFTKRIFPLLQTCTQLRTQLQPLRTKPIVCYISTDHFWVGVLRAVKKWRQLGFHTGPTTIIVSPKTLYRLMPSTAAAMAGALECALFGRLSQPPAVYIGLNYPLGRTPRIGWKYYYVSHLRATDMLMKSVNVKLLDDPASHVNPEEGLKVWEDARAKTRDLAP